MGSFRALDLEGCGTLNSANWRRYYELLFLKATYYRLLVIVKWKATVNEGVINNITKMARVLVGVKRVIDFAVKVSVTTLRYCILYLLHGAESFLRS